MSTTVLNVKGLSVWFESDSGRAVTVDNISFSIGAGEITGLVGESGCGKTMMINAILGLLRSPGLIVESTAIEICGRDISVMSEGQRRRILGRDIAMVFQQPGTALDPVFNIGQQIAAVHRRHTDSDKISHRKATMDSLEAVGFDNPEKIAAAYPHELSGGMRQLAMIAMATVCKPAVLIADEPTTALDGFSRALILKQIERLRTDHGTAILLVSHDLSVIRQCCQNVMVMYCGRLLEKASCDCLLAQARHPYSAGLISCMPQTTTVRPTTITAIPGQVPAPHALPSGCHFAPRCEHAITKCTQMVPHFVTDNDGAVACFRPLQ